MKKLYISMFMLISLFFVTACTANTDQSKENKTPELVEVHIELPEKVTPQQESILKVHVTQGKENVDDADDIEFEIWKANDKDNSELIKAQHEKDGIYSVKKTFSDDGVYYVQTHVTARDMHVMPKKQFIVGNVSDEELKSLKEETESQGHSENNEGHHH